MATLTPVFKSADPYFNQRAAQRAYDLVMKMDEDEARVFTTMVVAEMLWKDMEDNQRTLQRHLDEVIQKRIERVAKTLEKTYVNKSLEALESEDGEFTQREQILAYAGALGVISKAVRRTGDLDYEWESRLHPRDPSSGRFRTKVSYSGHQRPIRGEGAPPIGTRTQPSPRRPNQREHQEAHMQLSQFMRNFDADADFVFTMKDKDTGEVFLDRRSGTGNRPPDYDPDKEQVLGVEARPATLHAGSTAFGLAGALGVSPERGMQIRDTVSTVDSQMKPFADEWVTAGQGSNNTNQRLYQRTATGSKYLEMVAPQGSKLHMAAKFGQFVGSHGPEAEKVLGPTARRTMYRYRGTEKTPDAGLREAVDASTEGDIELDLSPEGKQELNAFRQGRLKEARAAWDAEHPDATAQDMNEWTPIQSKTYSDATSEFLGRSPEVKSRQREHRRFAAMKHLMSLVPTEDLTALQLASGHTPPSEGVIIDSNGKIITQAVGYADDHYLPFNLKNLKGLKGGEYVRTRAWGGPTSEDIYTGLMSGARAITVVSNSGTFTMEFDDKFRGGRRYNQKAKRMVDRYEHLLDAVQSNQVQRQGLDPDTRKSIWAEIERDYPGYDNNQKREIYQRKEKAFKENPTPTAEMWDKWKGDVLRENMGSERALTRYELQQEVNAKAEAFMEGQAFNYRLDGRGYDAAMNSLREQFPYYLKQPNNTVNEKVAGYRRDKGYVKPRYNRPAEAQAGYYDKTITGAGKISADQVDYQNAGYGVQVQAVRDREAREAQEAAQRQQQQAGTPAATGTQATGAQAAGTQTQQQQFAGIVRSQSTSAASVNLANALIPNIRGSAMLNQTDENARFANELLAKKDQGGTALDDFLRDSTQHQRLVDASLAAADAMERHARTQPGGASSGGLNRANQLRTAVNLFTNTRDNAAGQVYNPQEHRSALPRQPFKFPEHPTGQDVRTARDQAQSYREALRSGSGIELSESSTDDDHLKALKMLQKVNQITSDSERILGRPPNPEMIQHEFRDASSDMWVQIPRSIHPLISRGSGEVGGQIDNLHHHWALVNNIKGMGPAANNLQGAEERSRPTRLPNLQDDDKTRAREVLMNALEGALLEEHRLPDEMANNIASALQGIYTAEDPNIEDALRRGQELRVEYRDWSRRNPAPRPPQLPPGSSS